MAPVFCPKYYLRPPTARRAPCFMSRNSRDLDSNSVSCDLRRVCELLLNEANCLGVIALSQEANCLDAMPLASQVMGLPHHLQAMQNRLRLAQLRDHAYQIERQMQLMDYNEPNGESRPCKQPVRRVSSLSREATSEKTMSIGSNQLEGCMHDMQSPECISTARRVSQYSPSVQQEDLYQRQQCLMMEKDPALPKFPSVSVRHAESRPDLMRSSEQGSSYESEKSGTKTPGQNHGEKLPYRSGSFPRPAEQVVRYSSPGHRPRELLDAVGGMMMTRQGAEASRAIEEMMVSRRLADKHGERSSRLKRLHSDLDQNFPRSSSLADEQVAAEAMLAVASRP